MASRSPTRRSRGRTSRTLTGAGSTKRRSARTRGNRMDESEAGIGPVETPEQTPPSESAASEPTAESTPEVDWQKRYTDAQRFITETRQELSGWKQLGESPGEVLALLDEVQQ